MLQKYNSLVIIVNTVLYNFSYGESVENIRKRKRGGFATSFPLVTNRLNDKPMSSSHQNNLFVR